MKMISIYLTEPQIAGLKKLAGISGLTASEIVRRSLDRYVEEKNLLLWCQERFGGDEDK